MKAMETLQDLIEEAKVRTVYWALCIYAVSYFLTNTSTSMWMNVPIAILLVGALRILFNEVELRWKVRKVHQQTYLVHLEKKQLSPNDSRLFTLPPPPKWKTKIDSPHVEAAMEDFVNKLLKDFVVDLWYSDITPDKEAPELIRAIIMDVLGEISGRVKEINLVDLLTRDIVDLVGAHLDLYRRNQAAIGVDVMGTLSSEERDERLKHHLMASKELHPALISPECEYKVMQKFIGGLLAVVLRPREAQCSLVRCIARELVTCLVMQPVMNFASPGYINELIEYIILATRDDESKEVGNNQSRNSESTLTKDASSNNPGTDMTLSRTGDQREASLDASGNLSNAFGEEPMHPRPADWARVLEAATQRRKEVLMPENLENMWTKGRNYQKKTHKNSRGGLPAPVTKGSEPSLEGGCPVGELKDPTSIADKGGKSGLRRSNSTSALMVPPTMGSTFTSEVGGPIISEFYSPDFDRRKEVHSVKSASEMVFRSEGLHVPMLRCKVVGVYFEKLGAKSFAVYTIGVVDADKNTWIVKRRYRNFERLHRHLKDIPNYTLHLPPKRIFSSSTEDAFVHQRCIQLDKYLQDLMSIPNVAEQHEVWDFLSVSSKNYSFGKSSSVISTLAVNVDDAVDDIVRQFKGVFGSSSSPYEASPSISERSLSCNADEINAHISLQDSMGSAKSFSDNEECNKDKIHGHEEGDVRSSAQSNGWHSDNELNSKDFPPRVVKRDLEESRSLDPEKKHRFGLNSELIGLEDPVGVPPEWTPPNLSVPVLNLVDNIFQLKRRGWLRRQVFWISKQILQLMMEDAIDDWLLRQIQWLRRDEIIAQGIRWVQDVLWPDGTFFLRLNTQGATNHQQPKQPNQRSSQRSAGSKVSKVVSFEQQLEAARRASDVKKMIFNGAPTTLVSLIGHKQYKRCAKDIYYFLQSTICLKQLAYAILELVVVSVFPEMREVLLDIHEKSRVQPV